MKKRAAYLIIFIFLVPLISFGQNRENNVLSIKENIVELELLELKELEWIMILENESKTDEVLMEIKRNTEKLNLFIHSQVRKGKVTIEVYDPNGTKMGYFSGGTLPNSGKEEVVKGDFEKSWVKPLSGKWRIKNIPIDATGPIKLKRTISYRDEVKNSGRGSVKTLINKYNTSEAFPNYFYLT